MHVKTKDTVIVISGKDKGKKVDYRRFPEAEPRYG